MGTSDPATIYKTINRLAAFPPDFVSGAHWHIYEVLKYWGDKMDKMQFGS